MWSNEKRQGREGWKEKRLREKLMKRWKMYWNQEESKTEWRWEGWQEALRERLQDFNAKMREKRTNKYGQCENAMLGSNNVPLTASLVARLSLGVSSDWEPAAHATGPSGGNWSSAALFSARCLVTMSWQRQRESLLCNGLMLSREHAIYFKGRAQSCFSIVSALKSPTHWSLRLENNAASQSLTPLALRLPFRKPPLFLLLNWFVFYCLLQVWSVQKAVTFSPNSCKYHTCLKLPRQPLLCLEIVWKPVRLTYYSVLSTEIQ